MRQPTAAEPAAALRYALASPFPELQDAARYVVTRALRRSSTVLAAAESLGISRQTMARLRQDHLELQVDPGGDDH